LRFRNSTRIRPPSTTRPFCDGTIDPEIGEEPVDSWLMADKK
jgi:hypothetical protein